MEIVPIVQILTPLRPSATQDFDIKKVNNTHKSLSLQ